MRTTGVDHGRSLMIHRWNAVEARRIRPGDEAHCIRTRREIEGHSCLLIPTVPESVHTLTRPAVTLSTNAGLEA